MLTRLSFKLLVACVCSLLVPPSSLLAQDGNGEVDYPRDDGEYREVIPHPFIEDRGVVEVVRGLPLELPLIDLPFGATRFGASGLPAGLQISETTGEISGTPLLSGNMTVVVHVIRENGPTAFLRFQLYVSASEDPGALRDIALPQGAIVRVPSLPAFGAAPAAFPVLGTYLNFAEAWPTGIGWNAGRTGLMGSAETPGVSAIPYTWALGEPAVSGNILISAGDYQSAASMPGGARRIATNGSVAIALSNDIRPLVRAELPQEWSSEALLALGVTPSWSSGMPTDEFSLPRLERLGDRVVAYQPQTGVLSSSTNGLEWTDAAVRAEAVDWGAGHHFYITEAGVMILSEDDGSGNNAWLISTDLLEWDRIDLDAENAPRGIRSISHNGEEWVVFGSPEVHTSENGTDWATLGTLEPAFHGLIGLSHHNGTYYALDEFPSPEGEVNNLFRSDDAITWELLPGAPMEMTLELIASEGRLFSRSEQAVYEWNGEKARFEMLWMSPPGTTLKDASYANGKLAIATDADAWVIDLSELSPQLVGTSSSLVLSEQVVEVGESIDYTLEANQDDVIFKAYGFPEGIVLDPGTGAMTGAFTESGIYELLVNVENESGVGIPRAARFAVHEPAVPHGEVKARFVRRLAPPTDVCSILVNEGYLSAALEIEGTPEGVTIIATGVPPGMTFDPVARTLAGWPSVSGLYDVTLHLFTSQGSQTTIAKVLLFDGWQNHSSLSEVMPGAPIEVEGQGQQDGMTYVAHELPQGLILDPATADISGSVAEEGHHLIHFSRKDAEGRHAFSTIYEFDVRGSNPQLLPIPPGEPLFVEFEAITESVDLSMMSIPGIYPDTTVEFISLPDGFAFLPPHTVEFDPGLRVGFHRATARISTPSGFKDVDWWFVKEDFVPEDQRFIIWVFGSTTSPTERTPYEAELYTELVGDHFEMTELPPGLSYDPVEGKISGEILEPGIYAIGLMSILDGKTYGFSKLELPVKEVPEDDVILPFKQRYFVGLQNREVYWHPYNHQDHRDAIRFTSAPSGVEAFPSNGHPTITGEARLAGPSMLRLETLNGNTYQWPTMVYPAPTWEADRPRAKFLPSQNLFQLSQVAVLERYSSFSPLAKFYSSTNDQTWTEHRVPASAPNTSLKDITVSAEGYLLIGDQWTSQAASIGTLNTAEEELYAEAVASNGSLYVAISRTQLTVSEDGETWDVLEEVQEQFLSSIAYGNGKFVAVGEGGAVVTMDTNQIQRTVGHSSKANFTDVTFTEGEFYAVGPGGVVLRSEDGLSWTSERSPQALGADFRYVTGNAAMVVAVSPHLILGKLRDQPELGWRPLERLSKEGSQLDDLQWENGEFAGGYTTGLYVPRRPKASVTVLSVPFQSSLLGERFVYDIGATGNNVSYRVEALPEGLTFDASRGRIEGELVRPGSYEMLIEATEGVRKHGKTLSIYCWEGLPRMLENSVEMPVGTDLFPQIPSVAFQMAIPFEELIDVRSHPTNSQINLEVEGGEISIPGDKELGTYVDVRAHRMADYVGTHVVDVRLRNPVGTVDEKLMVHIIPPKPSFPQQPRSQEVPIGSQVMLTATLQGRLPMDLQWYHNGEPLDEDDGYQGTASNELIINELGEHHLGEYYLEAINEVGTGTSSTAILSQLSGFADWASTNGIAVDDLLGDHNGDGWSNLLAYALADELSGHLETHLPRMNGLNLVYHRPVGREDVDYVIQRSRDLKQWDDLTLVEVVGEVSEFLEQVSLELSYDDEPAYYRLLIRVR